MRASTVAARAAQAWRQDYNEVRPHSSLENLTPAEFVRRLEVIQQQAGQAARPACYRWE
jgi:putative transposase